MISIQCHNVGCEKAMWQLRTEKNSYVVECLRCGDMRRIKFNDKVEE